MKVKFIKSDLLNALNTAGKAASAKTTMPILECFLITADDQGVNIAASDMELSIETHISSDRCQVAEPGMIAVEAKLFGDIIRKISMEDDTEILISSDGSLIEIAADKAVFRIQEKDPEQFPALPEISGQKYISLSQFALKEIIRDTIFATAVNDSNRMMTGELFEVKDNVLKVVALDGHRVAIKNTVLKEFFSDASAVIPGKTLNEIGKILISDSEKEALIFFDENYVCFRFGDTVMISRTIEGEFFKIDSMLSTDYETKVTANRKDLLCETEKAAILISESDKRPLVWKIQENTLQLRVNSQTGFLDTSLQIEKTGKDLMIAFNPKYLLDAFRVIDDELVNVYMTGPKAPCFIRDEKNTFIYLVLPVNFNPSVY